MEVTITVAVTFENKLDEEQINEVSDAMGETVADDLGISKKFVKADMTEKDARRHLLAITYEVVIIVSIPGAEAAKIVAENPKMAELSDPRKIAAVSTSFEKSLGDIPELKAANGGNAVTVAVKVELTLTLALTLTLTLTLTTKVELVSAGTSEPSSAVKVSSAFGLVASALYVAYTV
jgi:hypothetical protein